MPYEIQYLIRPKGTWKKLKQIENFNEGALERVAQTYRKAVSEQKNVHTEQIALRAICMVSGELVWNNLSQWDKNKNHMADLVEKEPTISTTISAVVSHVKSNVKDRIVKASSKDKMADLYKKYDELTKEVRSIETDLQKIMNDTKNPENFVKFNALNVKRDRIADKLKAIYKEYNDAAAKMRA